MSARDFRQCIFSPCRRYRYTLWREWTLPLERWDPSRYAVFIGLNPSTADEVVNDPTIRRCIDFANRWGYGALCMLNLFAWRDTKPQKMMKAVDPIGPLNDHYLFRLAQDAGIVVAAWGKHGSHNGREDYICDLFEEANIPLHRLRLNNDGSPEHPLYIPADTVPVLFK